MILMAGSTFIKCRFALYEKSEPTFSDRTEVRDRWQTCRKLGKRIEKNFNYRETKFFRKLFCKRLLIYIVSLLSQVIYINNDL